MNGSLDQQEFEEDQIFTGNNSRNSNNHSNNNSSNSDYSVSDMEDCGGSSGSDGSLPTTPIGAAAIPGLQPTPSGSSSATMADLVSTSSADAVAAAVAAAAAIDKSTTTTTGTMAPSALGLSNVNGAVRLEPVKEISQQMTTLMNLGLEGSFYKRIHLAPSTGRNDGIMPMISTVGASTNVSNSKAGLPPSLDQSNIGPSEYISSTLGGSGGVANGNNGATSGVGSVGDFFANLSRLAATTTSSDILGPRAGTQRRIDLSLASSAATPSTTTAAAAATNSFGTSPAVKSVWGSTDESKSALPRSLMNQFSGMQLDSRLPTTPSAATTITTTATSSAIATVHSPPSATQQTPVPTVMSIPIMLEDLDELLTAAKYRAEASQQMTEGNRLRLIQSIVENQLPILFPNDAEWVKSMINMEGIAATIEHVRLAVVCKQSLVTTGQQQLLQQYQSLSHGTILRMANHQRAQIAKSAQHQQHQQHQLMHTMDSTNRLVHNDLTFYAHQQQQQQQQQLQQSPVGVSRVGTVPMSSMADMSFTSPITPSSILPTLSPSSPVLSGHPSHANYSAMFARSQPQIDPSYPAVTTQMPDMYSPAAIHSSTPTMGIYRQHQPHVAVAAAGINSPSYVQHVAPTSPSAQQVSFATLPPGTGNGVIGAPPGTVGKNGRMRNNDGNRNRSRSNPPTDNSALKADFYVSSQTASRVITDAGLSPAAAALRDRVNPTELDIDNMKARFFVIKSFTQSDVQKSVKHGFWSSTIPGNERLDSAYSNPPPEYDPNDPNPQPWPVYLFFSINGSSRFCGVARMSSSVDRTKSSDVWDLAARWTGLFNVEWLFIRDVPNSELRHIVLSATDPRPVTNSRDTQELPLNAGRQMLSVFLNYTSSPRDSLIYRYDLFEEWSEIERRHLAEQEGKATFLASGPAGGVGTATPPVIVNGVPTSPNGAFKADAMQRYVQSGMSPNMAQQPRTFIQLPPSTMQQQQQQQQQSQQIARQQGPKGVIRHGVQPGRLNPRPRPPTATTTATQIQTALPPQLSQNSPVPTTIATPTAAAPTMNPLKLALQAHMRAQQQQQQQQQQQ